MLVRFTLTMYDLVVDGLEIQELVIRWTESISFAQQLQYQLDWMTGNNFLTKRMRGLKKVGESELKLEPMSGLVKD